MGASLVSEPSRETAGQQPDPRRRAVMEAFLVEAKPWALRQARRRFPHIPDDLYEDVYQQACIEMWQRGPQSLDKRSLYAYLAKVLNGTLGRAHKSWVHDHVGLTHDDGEPIGVADDAPEPDTVYDRRQLGSLLSELMNRRLLAPEKAVLQLQLGAGLDPDQVRAALDMTPRQYKRRRAEGLEKLRGALDDYLEGRVCEDHAGMLALAATGELPAGSAEQLHAHLEHCGTCRAEIRRLRSTVRARLAFAPWPFTIAAPGWLAVKLGGAGGAVAAKLGGAGTAAKLAATAATVATIAGTGAVVAASGDDPPRDPRPAAATQPATQQQESGAPATAQQPERAERREARRSERRQAGRERREADGSSDQTAATGPGSATAGGDGGDAGPLRDTAGSVTDTVRDTTDTVRDTTGTVRETVGDVTEQLPELPVPTPDVGGAVDDVTGAVDGTTGAVEDLLP